jgi:tetratricopeptide (TPR) repeat protein
MANLIAEYQSQLTAEESLTALDRAVNLARRVARGGRVTDGQRWVNLLMSGNGTRMESAQSAAAQRVLGVASLLQSLPPRAREPNVPESQYALLMDTLLLVFHQAYFVLLPKAATHRTMLLQAFDAFADELPNLADRFQVKGLSHLERGDIEQAIDAFNAALAATPSDQHDFLTRVQMVWSLLIEHHRVRDAFDCLMEVSPRVTRADYDEFQNLLRETFDEAAGGVTTTV